MFSSVKAIRPETDTGEHVDHPGTTFDPFYRSVMTYREMADYMDFIKPILYHDIAGPRTRTMYLSRVRRTIFKELSDGQALDLFYTLKGYDQKAEPRLEELDQRGLGPDYVYRETRRVVQDVAGRAKVYAGVGIDIPGNGGTFASNPEGVYQATRKAFEAGAAGVLVSREYDEMRLPNLRAVGRAMATSIAQNATYFCRMVGNAFGPCASRGFNTPGAYPINFFVLNPYIFGGTSPTGTPSALLLSDNSFSNYNGLQVEIRKRYARGLTLNLNYTWSHSLTDRYNKNVDGISNFSTLRNRALDRSPSPWDLRHVVQAFGTYDLPFGKARRFAIHNSVVDAVAGGWTIGSIFRFQTGLPFKLSGGQLTVNQQDAGVNSLVSADVLQSNVGVYHSGNPYVYFVNPKLIGADGRSNPTYLTPAGTAGMFGSFLYLYGPRYISDDVSIAKQMPLWGDRLRTEIRAEMVNAFNHPIFQVPTGGTFGINPISVTSTTFGRATATTSVPRQVQFRVRFVF